MTSHAQFSSPSSPSAPPCPPVSDAKLHENIALKSQLAFYLAMQAQKKVKKKLLDSGANIIIVSSLSHLDSNTFPTFLRADKPSVVETANNSTMEIQGNGQFEGLNSVLCESASNSLLSTS